MELYIANAGSLLDYEAPEVRDWASIYNLIALNVSLVDRSNVIQVPFRFRIYPPFEFARIAEADSLSYEACCDRRARELLALQEDLGVPLAVLYSGGIDSTLVLISFAKVLSPAELRERVHVYMSNDSIVENPRFYYDFVRRHCTIRASEDFTSVLDGRHIMVGGEHNDQLFGSDIIGKIVQQQPFSVVHQPYRRDFLVNFFVSKGLPEAAAHHWFSLLDQHIRDTGAPVHSVFEFFWWLNFIFKWQSVYFRILLRVDKAQRSRIDQQFCNRYYHHFYSPAYFQKWSMTHPELKIQDSWASYKFTAKDLIYEFNKDADYRRDKIKIGSLSRLFLQKDTAVGLSSEFAYLDSLRGPDLYQPDNSFKDAS
ncbi:hypothetical protein SAMN05192549_105169 [Duganella sacchari]|uniref:Asparagine synthase n=1 Tax=Duganella sacchari TaxID=551987 RepID=A0A1M7PKI2_9BURK|nr:hypothetical protein [Duganella sacchari]SHN17666.1 hypothetical protein SAMN05192549_105169 [Duganella sacchari]